MQFLLGLNIIGIIFISGIISGIYYFTGYDKGDVWHQKITTTTQELKSMDAKIRTRKSKLQETIDFDNSIKNMGKEIDYFLTYIPEKLTTLDIFKDLTSVSKASGIEITSMSNVTQSANVEQFYQSMAVNLSIKGGFSNFLTFLSKLTHLNKFITVKNVNLTPAGIQQSEDSQLVLAQINLVGFRYLKPIHANDKK